MKISFLIHSLLTLSLGATVYHLFPKVYRVQASPPYFVQKNRVTPKTTKPKTYNQYFDADQAFAKDTLFAVTSKKTIKRHKYTDHFDKTPLGRSKEKSLAPIYILRCLGRETRENYLFIVPYNVYNSAQIHQKFTKLEMSNYEYFLSEKRLEQEVFHRRFREKMID